MNMERSPQNIFLTLKKSQIRKILSSDNGRDYTDPEEIINELEDFYSSTIYQTDYKV